MKKDISVSEIEANVYAQIITLPFIGIFTGHSFVFVFGLFGILYSGKDILILWLLRNIEANSLVKTHSKRAGCYVLDRNED